MNSRYLLITREQYRDTSQGRERKGKILNYRIVRNGKEQTGADCILIMKQQLAERQEAGIISETALPYERLDNYFHNEDCLAQISWDEIV